VLGYTAHTAESETGVPKRFTVWKQAITVAFENWSQSLFRSVGSHEYHGHAVDPGDTSRLLP
jgi:hypothetical protein